MKGGGVSNWPLPQEKLPSKSPALLGLKLIMYYTVIEVRQSILQIYF